MNWVFGITGQAPRFCAELLSSDSIVSEGKLEALLKDGIPSSHRRARVIYDGEFGDWTPGDASKYLRAQGIEQWPAGTSNRHEVIEVGTAHGLTLHVPTLVLMRAFFRPTSHVFSVAFRPSNVGLLSFVDYSGSTQSVVIDNASLAKRLRPARRGLNQQCAINWMQMSRSAQRMVRSAHDNASLGLLKLAIPEGRVRISFVGNRIGNDVFVNAANLLTVVAPATDTISGAEETFHFAGQVKSKTILVHKLEAPRRADGELQLTSEEWRLLQPLLAPRTAGRKLQYTHREVLDLILRRMGRSHSWAELATKSIPTETLIAKYLAWKSDGRLELALSKLRELRACTN